MKRTVLPFATVLLAGCSVLGLGNTTKSQLEAEKHAWLKLGVHNYTYEYSELCFCATPGAVVVTVRADTVSSVVLKSNGQPQTLSPGDRFYTIPELYDYLISAADRADEMKVEYDKANHLPATTGIDFEKHAIDDEITILTSNFTRQ